MPYFVVFEHVTISNNKSIYICAHLVGVDRGILRRVARRPPPPRSRTPRRRRARGRPPPPHPQSAAAAAGLVAPYLLGPVWLFRPDLPLPSSELRQLPPRPARSRRTRTSCSRRLHDQHVAFRGPELAPRLGCTKFGASEPFFIEKNKISSIQNNPRLHTLCV